MLNPGRKTLNPNPNHHDPHRDSRRFFNVWDDLSRLILDPRPRTSTTAVTRNLGNSSGESKVLYPPSLNTPPLAREFPSYCVQHPSSHALNRRNRTGSAGTAPTVLCVLDLLGTGMPYGLQSGGLVNVTSRLTR